MYQSNDIYRQSFLAAVESHLPVQEEANEYLTPPDEEELHRQDVEKEKSRYRIFKIYDVFSKKLVNSRNGIWARHYADTLNKTNQLHLRTRLKACQDMKATKK